jgi:hypothetical protein
MRGIWSTQVEINFMSSQSLEWFGEHMLRCILFSRWHGRGLVNESLVTFCVLADMGGIWSTQVEIHFMSLLEWKEFDQHM